MSITSAGLTRPKLAELKLAIDQRLTDALGPVNTGPDSVLGQVTGIVAEQLDAVWQAVEFYVASMSPDSASGVFLDYLGSIVGIPRLTASPTTVVGAVYGDEGTLLPQGTQVTDSQGNVYTSDASVTISRSNALEVKLSVTTVTASTSYQLVLDGASYTVTSSVSPTNQSIAAQLAGVLNAEFYQASAASGVLTIRSADGVSPFAITYDPKLTLTSLATPVSFRAEANGDTDLPIGSLAQLSAPLPGVSGVTNFVVGTNGRLVESDENYRARFYTTVYATGTGTRQSIQARLLSISGVSYARVYENRSAFVVDGQPPHSFEAIVDGGAATSIARVIYENKPAGIETFGTVAVQITDENDDTVYIRFSRPVNVYAWVRVTVTALNPEEQLTPAAAEVLRSAIAAYGNSLNVGDDLYPQRFYGAVFGSTQGIGSVNIELALTTGSEPPVYSTAPITVSRGMRVLFDATRVTVLGV